MTVWCECVVFAIWYEDDGHRVCRCGHPDRDHVDGQGMCVGDVDVSR